MVTSAPRLEVPDTANVDRSVAAPSRSKLPVMVNPLVPPASVDPKLTIDAVMVLLPPDNVTPLVYVCVDEVVTSAPRLDVPETSNVDNPVAAPSRPKLPVMVNPLVPPARVSTKLTIDAVKVLLPPDKVTPLV